MEVAFRPKFILSLSHPAFARHGFKEVGFFSPSSSVLSCTYKRLQVGWSSHNEAILRISNDFSPNGISCFPRKQFGVLRQHSNRQIEFQRSYGDKKLLHFKFPRDIVVRSELAESGTPAAASSLPELQFDSKVRGICFYTVTSVLAIFLCLVMLLAHPFVLLFDWHRRKFHHFIAKTWATLTIIPFLKVKYEGLENLPTPDTPAVYVSNHQSFIDTYALLTLGRSFKFISKTGIFLIPIIGWAMFMMGIIPLKRMDSRSQLQSIKRCMDLIKKGASVFFFPEGTRSKDGKLGAFKKGAFSIAAKMGVPVVPITLMGTGKIMPLGLESMVNSGSIKVIIHKPIDGNDAEALCNEARNTIADALSRQG